MKQLQLNYRGTRQFYLLYSNIHKMALFKMCEVTQGSVFSVYLSVCLLAHNTNNSLGRIGVAFFVFLCEKLKFIS